MIRVGTTGPKLSFVVHVSDFFQYIQMKKEANYERDTLSQISQDSTDSNVLIAASDIRKRLADSLSDNKTVKHDPEDPSAAALKVSLVL